MKRVIILALLLLLFAIPSLSGQRPLRLYEIRNRTEYLLNQDTLDTANDFWSDAELDWWINDGMAFIAERAKCVVRETTITIAANTDEYAMPHDFISVISFKLSSSGATASGDGVNTKGIKRSEGFTIGKTVTKRQDGPFEYEDVGQIEKKIRLTPVPVKAYTGEVKYAAYCDSMISDTDRCDLPRSFQGMLATYAERIHDPANMYRDAKPLNQYAEFYLLKAAGITRYPLTSEEYAKLKEAA